MLGEIMPTASLPQFTKINPKTFVDTLDKLLQTNLKQIDHLLTQAPPYRWDNLMIPLDDLNDALEKLWSPFAHLHAVVHSPELRDCFQSCLPKLSTYEATIGHNETLYQALCTLDKTILNQTQQKILDDTLRDFKLSGVALSPHKKQRYEEIQTRLSHLSNQFENNVLDSGMAYQLHITDPNRLSGLPEHTLQAAHELALEKKGSGWMLNLEFPCYIAVMTHADDKTLRKEIYRAYITRASDQTPSDKKYSNTSVMNEILALRHEKANLLGYANYAELSLATKMAQSTDQVIHFLTDLNERVHQQAMEEFHQLHLFAEQKHGIKKMAPWDIAYLSEKKRHACFEISQEELRAFFPLPKVMDGLFKIIHKLYSMTLKEVSNVDKWHPDVRCYQIHDQENHMRGYIYLDLFARPNKRSGAWMDSCQNRRCLPDGSIQPPIATLTCNFTKAMAMQPALLSHDEVLTLFHEFGHCLQHVLTLVDELGAAGINGVEWDAVELPSQFFENWCWNEEALRWLTAHKDTSEPLPALLFERLWAAKNFQSAMALSRQLEFALFDFKLHQKHQTSSPKWVEKVLANVRKTTTVVPIAPFNRFQHSFSHIFAGGYAGGYYSYLWAEVLSSDAFSRFEEEGLFNIETGHDFLHQILETGGSRKASDTFIAFRGRKASMDALLKHNGIQSKQVIS